MVWWDEAMKRNHDMAQSCEGLESSMQNLWKKPAWAVGVVLLGFDLPLVQEVGVFLEHHELGSRCCRNERRCSV